MNFPRNWRTRSAIVLGFAAVLCTAVLYSRAVRRVALGQQFQYIPRESEFIIAVGDLESLSEGLERFFRTAQREDGPLKWIGDELKKKNLPMNTVKDLEAHGIDIRRGILFSIYRPTAGGDSGLVVVLPTIRQDALLAQLSKGKKVSSGRIGQTKVHDIEGLLVSFPEKGLAVMATSQDLLRRSLTLRTENLAHATNNDALYHAVRHVARGPLLVGPNIFFYWQSRTAPFDERSAILRLSPDEVELEGEVELSGGTLRVIDALRRPSTLPGGWMNRLPADTLGLAVLQDDQLTLYRDFVAEQLFGDILPVWSEAIERWAPGTNPPSVQRIAVAMTDIEDGVPDFLMGLWGKKEELEPMLPLLQREIRRSRDLALLRGAIEKYRRQVPNADAPSVTDLHRLRILEPEDDSLFHRYPIEDDDIGDPTFTDADFKTKTYEREVAGKRVRFLAPPIGNNDLTLRAELSTADPANLKSDRYRMATIYDAGALWIATDVRDLESVLGTEKRVKNQARGPVLEKIPNGAKLRVALDLGRVTEMSLLSPGSQLEKLINGELREMQDFSALEVDAAPSFDLSRLHFSASLRRRTPP